MKKNMTFLPVLFLFLLTACSGGADAPDTGEPVIQAQGESASVVDTQQIVEAADIAISVEYDSNDLEENTNSADITTISLNGDVINVDGSGVEVDNQIVKIIAAGTYNIEGRLNDGQIRVDAQDEEVVVLVLDGVDITSSTGAPIYVLNADKVIITLAEGTENIITDGASYVFPDAQTDEPNAAIFSEDDLTINGTGSLIVTGNHNHGIVSKDDLKITGGTITVNAVNDGLKGRDSIAVLDGVITINAGGDGLQSNNDEDAEKGYIVIDGGTLNIAAGLDGIQAETQLRINQGELNIVAGGGSNTNFVESAKGLKGGVDVAIVGGTIEINSADDAIHSNGTLSIDGGDLILASGDDGVHADVSLTINGGNLTVTESYEGLESAVTIINDGNLSLVASDDGINGAGGNDGSGMRGPGQDNFNNSSIYLEINGGVIAIDNAGDSIDVNGPATMNGGAVLINNAPATNDNGMLDVDGSFTVNGGLIAANGGFGMGISINSASTQNSVVVSLSAIQAGGAEVRIQSDDGQEIMTFTPSKEYQNLFLTSPDFVNGATYHVYAGNNEVASFTIEGVVTGNTGGMGGGPRGGDGGGGGPRPPGT